MNKFSRFFRLSGKNEWMLLALVGAVFYLNCYTGLFPNDGNFATNRSTLHTAVLRGHARAPYQYQMFSAGLILEGLLRLLPDPSPLNFSALYSRF